MQVTPGGEDGGLCTDGRPRGLRGHGAGDAPDHVMTRGGNQRRCGGYKPAFYSSESPPLPLDPPHRNSRSAHRLLPTALSWQASELQPAQPQAYSSKDGQTVGPGRRLI